ncbi:MAG: hypothetical protein HDR23_07715 [Lachnospiraceae bacterium]|nr:hypothetical protein [Lachnospiraceae bacterium]
MAVFHIAAFAALILFIAYKEKETLVDVIPVAVCILVLVLYGLAFVNSLPASDYLAVFLCFAAVVLYIRRSKEGREDFFSYVLKELQKPGSIIALVLLILVPVLTCAKAVTWWDDYNFWASDAKAVFYINGFAEKYKNVSPEFGDYPPGTQMMKWWFLHMHPAEFKEGLMFAGYYFMNLAFLVPLLKYLKKRNIPLMILMGAALWLFPSCVEVFGYDGSCADLTMAVIYGAFLTAVIDREQHSRLFYYGRQALFLMVLVLCKNVGFMWVAFALLFMYGYHIVCLQEGKESLKGIAVTTLLPIVMEGSWLLFCLLNRRIAKLTGTALHMVTGSMNIPEVKQELIHAYVTAFWSYPLHRWKTFAIDLSPLGLYLLLLIFVWILYKRGKIDKKQGIYIGSFMAVSGICFYAVNLISHLTIFAIETQYLEPFGMVSSIERYGAPFTIGGLYLIAYLTMRQEERSALRQYGGILICLAFVFLTADYKSAYRGLMGYKASVSAELEERQKIVDDNADEFLTKVRGGQFEAQGRVLYLRDISDTSWVRNTYVSFEASPVSVMYGNVDAQSMSTGDIVNAIKEAHAGYLYADEIINGKELLTPLTEEEIFEFGCLYRIEQETGNMLLIKADRG